MKNVTYKVSTYTSLNTDTNVTTVHCQLIFDNYESKKAPGWNVAVEIPLKKTCTELQANQIAEYYVKRPLELEKLLDLHDTGIDSLRSAVRG